MTSATRTTEGWWNVSSRSCETLLRGALVARYYYIYAVDYDRGGEWLFGTALARVFATGRVYRDATTLVDPRTGGVWSTLQLTSPDSR